MLLFIFIGFLEIKLLFIFQFLEMMLLFIFSSPFQDGKVDFKEFVIGLLILGGNSAATALDDEALDFMFR